MNIKVKLRNILLILLVVAVVVYIIAQYIVKGRYSELISSGGDAEPPSYCICLMLGFELSAMFAHSNLLQPSSS